MAFMPFVINKLKPAIGFVQSSPAHSAPQPNIFIFKRKLKPPRPYAPFPMAFAAHARPKDSCATGSNPILVIVQSHGAVYKALTLVKESLKNDGC